MTDPKSHQPVSLPDWVSKIVAAIDVVRGHTIGALALASIVLLFAPAFIEAEVARKFQADWGPYLWASSIGFSLLWLSRIVYWGQGKFVTWRTNFVKDKRRKEMEAIALENLDSLSSEEQQVIAHQVEHNENSLTGNASDAVFAQLRIKGLIQVVGGNWYLEETPMIIPRFVWRELQARKVNGELFK